MDYNQIIMYAAVLGGISEALSIIPQIKSNGIFQMIYNLLKKFTVKK